MIMFSEETAGKACAIVAGWGNFGAGVANILLPAINNSYNKDQNESWKITIMLPAIILLLWTPIVYFCS